MAVRRGFYRHHDGYVFYVHGVAVLRHEHDRPIVVYTSVKTEAAPGYDFLARDLADFVAWVHPDGAPCDHRRPRHGAECQPRFARIEDPEDSVLPPLPTEE